MEGIPTLKEELATKIYEEITKRESLIRPKGIMNGLKTM